MSRSSVVLPVPDGPMNAVMRPAARGDVQAVEDLAAADGVVHVADLNNGIAGWRRRSVRVVRHRIRSSVHVVRVLEGREG